MGLTIIKGIITGIILSLPFGPVGLYCTELTISKGKWKGYSTALGMVTMDVLYSLIALLFISKVEFFILRYENILSLLVGIFLMGVATKKIFFKTEIKEIKLEFKNIIQNYFTGVAFALANVSTIFFITMIFTALKVYNIHNLSFIFQISIGVALGGSGLWFLTTSMVAHYRKFLDKNLLFRYIKFINCILLILSLFLIIKTLIKLYK